MRAFSLVELSIVLVILGLLTGGILAGQSLIRAAELRAVSAEYSRYVAATHTFRDKYRALPGDMANATRFWLQSSTASNCANTTSAATAATGTCDGNGNGTIQAAVATAGASGELHQFWRQLALAGLVEGTYTGVQDTNTTINSVLIGTNAPASKSGSRMGWMAYAGQPDTTTSYTLPSYGNYLMIGAQSAGTVPLWTGALTPEEAWNIDTKLDDGKPATGKTIARGFDACGQPDTGAATTTNLAASYAVSNSARICSLYFINQF